MTRLTRSSMTLNLYFIREYLPYYFFSLSILTTLIFSQQLVRQSDLLTTGLPGSYLFKIILDTLPGVLVITIPISCLFATLLSTSRLASDQETTGLNSVGLNSRYLSLPFVCLSGIAVFVSILLNFNLQPVGLRNIRELRTQIIKLSMEYRIRPQALSTNFDKHLIFVKDTDKVSGDWNGVFVIKQQTNEEILILSAEKGQLHIDQNNDGTPGLQLTNGLAIIAGNNSIAPKSVTRFTRFYYKIAESTQKQDSQPESFRKEVQEWGGGELQRQIEASSGNTTEYRIASIEWHKRASLAFSSLVLTAAALLLGFSIPRTFSRTLVIGTGFVITIIYYLLIIAGQNLALTGLLPPIAGLWGGHLIILLIASVISFYSSRFTNIPSHLRQGSEVASPDTVTDNHSGAIYKKSKFHLSFNLLSLINYLIVSETFKYSVVSAFILTSTTLIFTLFDIVPAITRNRIPGSMTGLYLWFLFPQIFFYTAPFGVALGVISAFAVLSRTNQITAVFSHGQSVSKVILPVLGIVCLFILGLSVLSERVLPYTNSEQDQRYNLIKGRKPDQIVIALGKKWVISSDKTLYGFSQINDNNQLLNTTAYSLDSAASTLCQISYAASADQTGPTTWEAVSGGETDYYCTKERQMHATEPVRFQVTEGKEIFRRFSNESSKMNRSELRRYISQLAQAGSEVTALRIDLEKKLAFPFSCFVLALITLPFCLSFSRKNINIRITIGLGLCILFWISSGLLETLGKQSLLPVWMAVWGVYIIFTALGGYIFLRLQK
jgi:lipopolysaccharide export LptBFGC system permease protein LptF